ncbi:MAG TPA: phosphotyrosine protein phosphatase [Myxococcota bacterium]
MLFICGRNRKRSPTAEVVLRAPGIETDSAGVRPDADVVVDPEQVAWADLIVLMENRYRKPLLDRVGGRAVRDKRIVSLDIADDYEAMDPTLIALLRERFERFVR